MPERLTCGVIEIAMRRAQHADMLRIAFAGTFAGSLEGRVRDHLVTPCDVIRDDERGIVQRLADVDVLITLAFTPRWGRRRGA